MWVYRKPSYLVFAKLQEVDPLVELMAFQSHGDNSTVAHKGSFSAVLQLQHYNFGRKIII